MAETDNNFIPEETSVTDAAEGQPASENGGKKRKDKKPKEKFSVRLKRNRKKILISLVAVLTLGVVLAVILVPTHFATLNEPGDFISIPVVSLPLDTSVTVEKSGSYIAHPDSVWVDDGTDQGKIIVMYPLGHGKGELAMRVSSDMGLTWSDRVSGLPESFKDSQETPTLYNLHFTDGSEKLVMISGCPYWVATKYKADGFNFSFSDDGGETWSEFEKFHSPADAIVAMSSLTQLKENGEFVDKWMGLFHDHSFDVYKTVLSFDENGDAEWSEPELLMPSYADITRKYGMCEVEIIREPESDTLILFARTEKRISRSLISFSYDEGATWTEPKELPYELSGDRHKAEYDPVSGKLIITMRSIVYPRNNPNLGWYSYGWVAWIGDYEDLKRGEDGHGDMLVKLAHTYGVDGEEIALSANADTGYAGLTVMADGTVVAISYGTFSPMSDEDLGGKTYVMAKRFKVNDLATVGGVTLR